MKQRILPSSFVVNGKRLLRLYSYYSLVLALLLLLTTVLDREHTILGSLYPLPMLVSAVVYVLLAAIFAGAANLKLDPQLATGYIFIEIAILAGMMYCSGGLATGFPSLIAISVVISNLLTPGLLGYGVAAWTTIAVLYTQIILASGYGTQDTFTIGMFGFLCFILSWITQSLSHRLNSALSLTSEQAERIQRLQQLSQQALQNLDSGVVACNEQNEVLFINQQAQQWLQLNEGELVPTRIIPTTRQKILPVAGYQLLVKKIMLTGSYQGGYLLALEDNAQVVAQAQQLKLASLGRLTASIAHEIRNPLSALKQATQLLKEADYLQATEKDLAEISNKQCDRINKIIEDVLQLSRRQQARRQRLNLAQWLQNFEADFRLTHFNERFQLTVDCSDRLNVFFDSSHLQQIMHNLCANALRHAQKQAKESAQINITVASTSAAAATIAVIDNGGGVERAKQQYLFEPFFTDEHNGTGLGLYLCRELCEANRARISYRSVANGACFWLMVQTVNNKGAE